MTLWLPRMRGHGKRRSLGFMAIDKKRACIALGAVVGVGALYHGWWRRPILTWGATEAETAARLPGDEFLEGADGVSTRAIDICAPSCCLAMARADGSGTAGRRLHL